jgi:type IV pilus assembly protein PilN
MPRINLLPWREAERKRKRQEFGVGVVAAMVLAGVLSLAVNRWIQSEIDDQNDRNQYLNTEIASLDKQIVEILALDQQKQRLLARTQVIEQLERSRPEIVHIFDQLVRTLPDGVFLTSIKQTDRKIQLKGVAQSSTRVASYMRSLDESEWLTNASVEIMQIKGTGDAATEFTLTAVQENPQLPAAPTDAAPARAGAVQRGASR